MFALLPVKGSRAFLCPFVRRTVSYFCLQKNKEAVGKRIAIQDNNNTSTTQ